MCIRDRYSGTGTIAQILAPVAKKVVGVEIVEEAVEAAKENAALNGLDNCSFWAGDVLKVIDELGEVPDLIMLDPPRDGVHPKALEKICNFGVNRLVYIACKPTSLARDLEMLQGRGYRVERIACIDLFPSTVHVETVCLLSRGKVDGYVNVDLDTDKIVSKSKTGTATYKEIKEYINDKYGFTVSSLNIAQVKDKCGLNKRNNYNKGKEGHKVPACPEKKEKAIKEAFAHFGLV